MKSAIYSIDEALELFKKSARDVYVYRNECKKSNKAFKNMEKAAAYLMLHEKLHLLKEFYSGNDPYIRYAVATITAPIDYVNAKRVIKQIEKMNIDDLSLDAGMCLSYFWSNVKSIDNHTRIIEDYKANSKILIY